MKIGDVYDFRYHKNAYEGFGDPYHCFDGQLVVKENDHRGMYLEDTYWSSGNKWFTPEEAEKRGTLTFRFNLSDVEDLGSSPDYYDNKDLFNFSSQKGCHRRILIRKGAVKSKTKIVSVINRRLSEEKNNLEWTKRRIKNLEEKQIIAEYFGIEGVHL